MLRKECDMNAERDSCLLRAPQPKTCVGAAERQGVQRHCMAQSILRGRSYGFHVEVSEANRVGMGSQVRHPTARPTRNLW